jgi:hypothetical protein
MCQWQADGVPVSFVAVNVSSRLFARRELYQQVARCCTTPAWTRRFWSWKSPKAR